MAVLLVAFLGLLPAAGRAEVGAKPLVLTGERGHVPLRGHLGLLDDPKGGLGIEDVAASGDFQPRPPDAVERNYTEGAVWYRFAVVRSAGAPADWVLSIGEPFIEDIRIFVATGDGAFRESRLGRRIPNDELPLAARLHVAKISVPEGAPATIYVRLASRDEILFDAALWQPDALLFSQVRQTAFFGMFFAAVTLIVMIYVLFGIWLRDTVMLSYAAYLLTFTMFAITHTGFFAIVFAGSGGSTSYAMIGIGVLGNVAAMIFMWDRILDLRRNFPRAHRLYMLACGGVLLSLPVLATPWYILLVRPTFVATMLVTVVSLGLAIVQIRRGKSDYLLLYYVIAFVPFLFFSLLHAAEVLFPAALDIFLVRGIGTLAILAHIAILSAALAHRIGLVQAARLRADADLAATRSAMREHRNFVAMLSHQLRTPMAIILAAIDVFDQKQPGMAHTAKIRRAVLRMRDLTADVLADSRLTEVIAPLNARSVALAPLLGGLVEERRDHVGQRLSLDLGDGGAIHGDPTLIGVLFANLLDNAIKYSVPDGEIRVMLASRAGTAVVTVADDGPGISPQDAERIFEKFYRSETVAAQSGTGLGLYLVRQIAHRHGGSVALASSPGQGTTFTVTLPLADKGGE